MSRYYVAHRLFAAHDRALGAYVARLLSRQAAAESVFLPFCDTDEENLNAPVKGRRLFELDRDRLRGIDGMIALLHGPSLDDGVCMEIGYAAALGVPVVAVTTDFQTYAPGPQGPVSQFPDPLLDLVLTALIRIPRLAPPPRSATDRFSAFLSRNLNPLRDAADQAISALLSATPGPACVPAASARTALIEPSPYLARELWSEATGLLASRGWQVRLTRRFRHPADTLQAAQEDLAISRDATLILADVSGPECPPGAALLIGACAATGRPVLAANPGGWWTFAGGREPNWRNLMIQYAVNGHFSTPGELAALLDQL